MMSNATLSVSPRLRRPGAIFAYLSLYCMYITWCTLCYRVESQLCEHRDKMQGIPTNEMQPSMPDMPTWESGYRQMSQHEIRY